MSKRTIKIAPSILSADFTQLGEQIREVEGVADLIHIDVMDGHFVPNITIGPMIVSAVNQITDLPLDVHLMIEKPEDYIENFVEAGADLISVHLEACPHLHRVIQQIKTYKIKAGVALNPATAITNLVNILEELDFVLVMSVNPGFGGQKFIPHTLEKIHLLKSIINARKYNIDIEVDGGVGANNAAQIAKVGADILVAGNAVFTQPDLCQAVEEIRRQALSQLNTKS